MVQPIEAKPNQRISIQTYVKSLFDVLLLQ